MTPEPTEYEKFRDASWKNRVRLWWECQKLRWGEWAYLQKNALRIGRNKDGTLDEFVAIKVAYVHLEHKGNYWWMHVRKGTKFCGGCGK